MKATLILIVLCLCFEQCHLALQTCAQVGSCPTNSACSAAGQPCACSAGYHENADSTGCDADKKHGQTCTTKGLETECISDAVCTNLAQAGAAEDLKCTCKIGFHPTTETEGNCDKDKSIGDKCEKTTSHSDCEEGSVCTGREVKVMMCGCGPGYHEVETSILSQCLPDVAPGGSCEKKEECVENSDCVDTAAGGSTPAMQCVCNNGFHTLSNSEGASVSCAADVAPQGSCEKDEECVENSSCVDTAAVGSPPAMKCVCLAEFHTLSNSDGTPVSCEADTCEDTQMKCNQAGITDCSGANNFLKCILGGSCDPADQADLIRVDAALDGVKTYFTADCGYSSEQTCDDQVIGCMNIFLKTSKGCQHIQGLKTCMEGSRTTCSAGSEAFKLADALQAHLVLNQSCGCVDALTACKTTADPLYTSAADDTQKCSAAKGLLTCSLGTTGICNLSKPIDNEETRKHVNVAFAWTKGISCDTLDTTTPDTCDQQLAHCVFIVGKGNEDDHPEYCKIYEEFGSCIDTDKCGEGDAAKLSIFTEQYQAVSGTCKCPNKLNACNASAQMIPRDPYEACPKLVRYASCVMGAECSLLAGQQDVGILTKAHHYYTTLRTNRSCGIPSDDKCASNLGACADTLIDSLANAADNPAKCNKTGESLLCANAANCLSEINVQYLTPIQEAAKVRLASLSCAVPSCKATNGDLEQCHSNRTRDFQNAADNTAKCSVNNKFVDCLRGLKCNSHMRPRIEEKYDAITPVTNCELKSLDGPDTTSAARSLSVDVLTVLLVTVGVVAAASS